MSKVRSEDNKRIKLKLQSIFQLCEINNLRVTHLKY